MGAVDARSPWASLVPLCVAVGLYKTDATIVNVALPTIQRQLDTTPSTLLWTVNAYILALTAIIPLAGALLCLDSLRRQRRLDHHPADVAHEGAASGRPASRASRPYRSTVPGQPSKGSTKAPSASRKTAFGWRPPLSSS